MKYDGETHYPLGSASHYFKQDLIPFIDRYCDRPRITLHIGAQPNSDPHIGNIVTFALASALKEKPAREIRISFVFVETAPAAGQDVIIKVVRYQKSLAEMGDFMFSQRAFTNVLERLSLLSSIPYDFKTQDFWCQGPEFPMIFYASLILDCSGSKLSKSLYVKERAYEYLCEAGLGYTLDTNVLLDAESGLEALFAEVQQWADELYK